MPSQLSETTGYSCAGGWSSPKTGQGNKGVFLQIICYNLQKVNVGSEGGLQLLSLKKKEKKKNLNHDFQRSMIKFLFGC